MFIALTAPPVPLVLLEAECVSTALFDCLDQVNVPTSITGIVILRHQDNPLMLLRKSDYYSLHQKLKNPCVAVCHGTKTRSCGNKCLLSKRKTSGKNVIRKRQPSEENKVSFNHKQKISMSGLLLMTLALLVVLPYVTLLCIKQARAQRHKHDRVPQIESTKRGETSSLEAVSPLKDPEVMISTRVPITKIACASSTQVDHANLKTTDTQTNHEMSQGECSNRAIVAGARETTSTDSIEHDSTMAGK